MHDSLIRNISKTNHWMDHSYRKKRNALRLSISMIVVRHAQTFPNICEIPNLFLKFYLFHVVWFHYKFLIYFFFRCLFC